MQVGLRRGVLGGDRFEQGGGLVEAAGVVELQSSGEGGEGGGAGLGVGAEHGFEDGDGFCLADDLHSGDLAGGELAGELAAGGVGDQDGGAEELVEAFEARGEVAGISHEGVIETLVGAEVADDDLACVDAGAAVEVVAEPGLEVGRRSESFC